MTPIQKLILDFIVAFRAERGYSPTLQEIADARGVSKNTLFEQVHALIRKGELVHVPNVARSIRPSDGKTNEAIKIVTAVADRLYKVPELQDELRRAAGILMGA